MRVCCYVLRCCVLRLTRCDFGDQMPSLKNIIYTDDKVKPEDRLKKPVAAGVDVYSFQEVIELGERTLTGAATDFTPPTAKRFLSRSLSPGRANALSPRSLALSPRPAA